MGAVENAFAGDAGQKPGEFRDLRDVRLPVKNHPRRIQPGGQPACGNLQRAALDARRLVDFDQRVVVGQEVVALHPVAQAGLDRGTDRAHIVAQMGRAGGGDASKEADICGHGAGAAFKTAARGLSKKSRAMKFRAMRGRIQ